MFIYPKKLLKCDKYFFYICYAKPRMVKRFVSRGETAYHGVCFVTLFYSLYCSSYLWLTKVKMMLCTPLYTFLPSLVLFSPLFSPEANETRLFFSFSFFLFFSSRVLPKAKTKEEITTVPLGTKRRGTKRHPQRG